MVNLYQTFPRKSNQSSTMRRHSSSSAMRPLLVVPSSTDDDTDYDDNDTAPMVRTRTSTSIYDAPYWKYLEDETEELRRFRTTSTYATYNNFLFEQAGESSEYLPDVGIRRMCFHLVLHFLFHFDNCLTYHSMACCNRWLRRAILLIWIHERHWSLPDVL